jgi:predicted ester cyclase
METEATYTAFAGTRRVAAGALRDVLPVLKHRFDRGSSELVLVFEVETGRQVDFDLRGSLNEVLGREAPKQPRGPGRPKLGVTSREVSLLPRHWDWLEQQSNGVSGALRRLVEQAIKERPGKERARRTRAALSRFLSSMAGDRPHYEEATRALFSGDNVRFEALVRRWPKDIREYALKRANEAAHADEAPLDAAAIVIDLHRQVWSCGDYGAIERLVAPRYVIHSDPGDPWEGQSLDRMGYKERVQYSRHAFPDLVFSSDEVVAAGDRAAVRWRAEGKHSGNLRGLPATGKRLRFAGQTMYEMKDGQVAGHWQVVDRLGFVEQLRQPPPVI